MSYLLKLLSILTLTVAFTRATITIQTANLIGNTTNTVHWNSSDLDVDPESFTMELNHPDFHSNLALANNIPTVNLQISFEMPDVPPKGGYTILFVENGNITNIFAKTGTFFVVENDVTGPHTGLVSPTLPPPTPSASSSLASNTTTPTSSSSSSSAAITPPASSSPAVASTPEVVIPNPSASSDNSTILSGNGSASGADAISIPLAAIFLTLVSWMF